MGSLYIGTSGWNYDHWKTGFYSATKRPDWLRYYAGRFNAVEVNATFYRLQSMQTFARWQAETPPHFRFCIKGHRYLTHNKRLKDPSDSIAIERERSRPLGDKLVVVLWQLPRSLPKHLGRLEAFVRALRQWDGVQHAVEFRHVSWFDDEVAACLRRHNVANCQSDAADWPMWNAVTATLVYVRLHGHTRTYASAYTTRSLSKWALRVRSWLRSGHTVHIYLDNDAEGAAPRDALRLHKLVTDG